MCLHSVTVAPQQPTEQFALCKYEPTKKAIRQGLILLFPEVHVTQASRYSSVKFVER